MKQRLASLTFVLTGLVIAALGMMNAIVAPLLGPVDRFNWLTGDAEVLEYLNFHATIQGSWVILLAFLVIAVAVTAYAGREAWAWGVLWLLPLYIGTLAALMPWLWPIALVLTGAMVGAQVAGRPAKGLETGVTVRRGWPVPALIGALVLVFAWHNAVIIPAIPPADAERGWAWLTIDPGIIDFIKFNFRLLGTTLVPIGLLVIALAAIPYRRGTRWAWWALAYVPVHMVWLLFLMPWTLPVMAVPLAALVVALFWERPGASAADLRGGDQVRVPGP